MNITSNIIQFELPQHLCCPQPTELRNLPRDGVRMLVTTGSGRTSHTRFSDLHRYLQFGDVLVVNTSATRASAVPITLPHGEKGVTHFSTRINEQDWLVEIRKIEGDNTVRWKQGGEGMEFQLPSEAKIILKKRFYQDHELLGLWIAEFRAPEQHEAYLDRHASPIKYKKLKERYPLDFYQTFFSHQPGSAEMPSAGRGFTPELVARLLRKEVVFAPILLHTGVSSLEDNEPPYPEYMEIDPLSAAIINTAKKQKRNIIAVGTTAVRAIESSLTEAGHVLPFTGNTDLFIDEEYNMKVINGLLTGFHEPRASHFHMLHSLAGFDHIERAYYSAIENHYYWHQFGDLHLILP